MAAAVVESTTVRDLGPFFMSKVVLKTLTTAQTENVSHGGPKGEAPIAVFFAVETEATDQKLVACSRLPGSDSLTNGTVAIVASSEGGGSIAGAKVAVYCLFASRQNQTGTSLDNGFTA